MLKNKFKHNVPKYVFASVDFFVYISSLFVAMMLTKHFFGGDLSPFLPGEDYNYRVLSLHSWIRRRCSVVWNSLTPLYIQETILE